MTAASVWDDGRLHHWVSTQSPHGVKRALAAVFGIEEADVRVVAPDVGGGFGPKFSNFPEDVMVAWAARHLGRAVRWVESRRESMTALHHGRAQRQRVRLGGSRGGDLQAYSVETAGTLDYDSELVLWFSGLGRVKLEFGRGVDITTINRLIGDHVL